MKDNSLNLQLSTNSAAAGRKAFPAVAVVGRRGHVAGPSLAPQESPPILRGRSVQHWPIRHFLLEGFFWRLKLKVRILPEKKVNPFRNHQTSHTVSFAVRIWFGSPAAIVLSSSPAPIREFCDRRMASGADRKGG